MAPPVLLLAGVLCLWQDLAAGSPLLFLSIFFAVLRIHHPGWTWLRQPSVWAVMAVLGLWGTLCALGEPQTAEEAKALTQILALNRPESPGNAVAFLMGTAVSSLSLGSSRVGLAVLNGLILGILGSLLLTLAKHIGVRPRILWASILPCLCVATLGPGSFLYGGAESFPALVDAVLIISILVGATSERIRPGIAAFLYILLLINGPLSALLLLPGLLFMAPWIRQQGKWGPTLRLVPWAAAVLLILPFARGHGKVESTLFDYSPDGIIHSLMDPLVVGWTQSLDLIEVLRAAAGSITGLGLAAALIFPLVSRARSAWRPATLYLLFILSLVYQAVLATHGATILPLIITALPLAALSVQGLWDLLGGLPGPRPRWAQGAVVLFGAMILVSEGIENQSMRSARKQMTLLRTAEQIWDITTPRGILICSDDAIYDALLYLERQEGFQGFGGADLLNFNRLGNKDYVGQVIRKRPSVLFSEFVPEDPITVARGIIGSGTDARPVYVIGDKARRSFSGFSLVPLVIVDRVDLEGKFRPPKDLADSFEGLRFADQDPRKDYYAEGLVRLSEYYLEAGQPQEALTALARALAFSTWNLPALKLRQKIFEATGQLERAQRGYQEILAKAPGDLEVRLALAANLLKSGMLEEAASQYNETLSLSSKVAEAHLGLGRIYAARGHKSSAIRSLEQGLMMDPRDEEARLFLAQLYLERDSRKSAALHLRRLLDDRPKDAEIQKLLMKALAPPTE